jgi:hypothetical protein
MKEFVFNSGSYEALLVEADRLGFTMIGPNDEKRIIVNGPLASGGSYFLNIVGTLYEPYTGPHDLENPVPPVMRPGYWGRLRANGDVADLPNFSDKIIQYVFVFDGSDLGGKWVNAADETPAPDFVADVGQIA